MKTFQKSFMLVIIFITMWSINSQAQNRLRVTNSGASLGTTTPFATSTFQVHNPNSTDSRLYITNSSNSSGAYGGLLLESVQTTSYIWNFDNGPMRIGTNNIDRLFIGADGRIGIGTTTPNPGIQLHITKPTPGINLAVQATGLDANNQGYSGISLLALDGSETTDWRLWNSNTGTYKGFGIEQFGYGYRFFIEKNTGNVGIGTTTPNYSLEVDNKVGGQVVKLSRGTGASRFLMDNNTNRLYILTGEDNSIAGTNNGIIIDPNGNVGVGRGYQRSIDSKLNVQGSVYSYSNGGGGESFRLKETVTGHTWDLKQVSSTSIDYFTIEHNINGSSNTRLMTFDGTTGRVGIGVDPPYIWAAGELLYVDGDASKPNGGFWKTLSDRRVKKNIRSFKDGLEAVLKIHPRIYQFNGKAGYPDNGKDYYGIIAQEMQQVAPYMIEKAQAKLNKNDKHTTEILSYDGSALPYMLVNAVKELNQKLEKKDQEIEKLKAQLAKMSSLEQRLKAIEASLGNTPKTDK